MEKGRTHGLAKRGQLIRVIDLLSVLNFSMDTYSSQNRSVAKGPIRFESEAALEAFIEKSSRPRMSVEGFNPYRPEDEIKRELLKIIGLCYNRRAFVILLGHGAGEKALQLNGSDIGDWNALVKVAPEEEEEEYLMVSRYKESLFDALLNDKKFRFGIMVKGYDTSLPADEVEREALALGLHGSEVRGFRITTRSLAKVRSNHPLAPGQTQTRRIGYTVPAHIIEFAPEIGRKVMAFKRIKRIMKKVAAFKRMKRTLKTRSGLL
ncbi:hypothetical protein IGI04_016784 [Brassica rapa subsp. trilocularis]|uniref:Uncharacterized protein n=1 Tax=Brassica rapa subsp. trilocularis TaxID=1813537 RepID=A0ABQ7MU02_BRACM|nr:hypothetical protein IGI04_016784 [Brassica rapa subsp. trilocularis]